MLGPNHCWHFPAGQHRESDGYQSLVSAGCRLPTPSCTFLYVRASSAVVPKVSVRAPLHNFLELGVPWFRTAVVLPRLPGEVLGSPACGFKPSPWPAQKGPQTFPDAGAVRPVWTLSAWSCFVGIQLPRALELDCGSPGGARAISTAGVSAIIGPNINRWQCVRREQEVLGLGGKMLGFLGA